jgi:two-component system, OmpR family, sensor histidine kinase CiaH
MSAPVGVRRQSIRVALSATLVVAAAYALIAAGVIAFATVDLTGQVDGRLTGVLDRVPPDGSLVGGNDDVGNNGANTGRPDPGRDPGRPFGAPLFVWRIPADGSAPTTPNSNSPTLPAELYTVTGPVTVTIAGTQFRVVGETTAGGSRIVAAQEMGDIAATQRTIVLGTLLIAPLLLGLVFVGAVMVGRRVAEPIEAARQRQLDFTADASHELRTPLSVIEAHTSLALAQERESAWYRNAFTRIDRESKRMRRLLEDMLWLARFDAAATPHTTEPVDLGVLAAQAADRFAAVAETRRLLLGVHAPKDQVLIAASPDLVDRLVGVLVDNACKYAPEGGTVDVTVASEGSRAIVTVDDSGPGIPEAERQQVFDRFHRSMTTSSEAGGAGLGLAIGDAIVRATGGRWSVESSPAGGARFIVTWAKATLGG